VGGLAAVEALDFLWRALAELYPLRCGGCDARGNARFCEKCVEAWPTLPLEHCDACALPYPRRSHTCVASLTGFERTYAAAIHAGVARRAVHAFKYRGQRALAQGLAERLYAAIPEVLQHENWLIVPVPTHPLRRRARGYDQAALLARALARRGGWNWQNALRRVRNTEPSPGLDRAARRANLADAFVCNYRLDGQIVLLVDDVLTTGATADVAASALKAAGVRTVHLTVVARAP
jgi:ComF family protein